VFLMELPWGGHETERLYDTLAEACEDADKVYAMGVDGGRWDVQRWDWQRPPAARPGASVERG
jgi:hypothetical protein